MATLTEQFLTGEKAAITNGKLKITFDTPADLLDWVERYPEAGIHKWQWCRP